MFDSLSERFETAFKKIRGRGSLSESNIKDALREVRVALLEADVSYKVVKTFIANVRQKAVGVEVMGSLTPGQQVIKVVHDELVHLMGEVNSDLNLAVQPPAVVMMVGLQGSGKTTTSGKLARRLSGRQNKKCLLASLDVYRPAAMDQLATVGGQVEVDVLPTTTLENPRDIAQRAVETAKRGSYDVVFLDTAGRLHVDDELMTELSDVKELVNPIEILLVADSMTGQDAVTVAEQFDQRLGISGVVLTKTDGDARGGAALSIRDVTGKPIKFVGTGEKLDALEPFHPDRIASRILGMGDVLTLVETAMEKVDLDEAAKLQEKITSKKFTLEDFLAQMQQVQKMGSLTDLVGMIPGMKQAMKGKEQQLDDSKLKRIEAIILSMTIKERQRHQLINASRKRRIAKGSGTSVQEVNRLLKQFIQTQKMMKRFGKLGKKGFMRGGMPGMPKMPGLPF
ncbi:MAG: signal recognition particle protein [Magnetococcales bacterium]|nr:signal recognition particle protein [Magnetococcales bacterium]